MCLSSQQRTRDRTGVISNQQSVLADSLECYMDEVVESFEDFVKKSLLLFSVGVCTVVVMLVYVLKMLTDKGGTCKEAQATIQKMTPRLAKPAIHSNFTNLWPVLSEQRYPTLNKREVTVQHIEPKVTCTSVNTISMKSLTPSYEEQVLRNIGFPNCHKSIQSGETLNINRKNPFSLPAEREEQRLDTSQVRQRRESSLPTRIPSIKVPCQPHLEGIWGLAKSMTCKTNYKARPIPTGDHGLLPLVQHHTIENMQSKSVTKFPGKHGCTMTKTHCVVNPRRHCAPSPHREPTIPWKYSSPNRFSIPSGVKVVVDYGNVVCEV